MNVSKTLTSAVAAAALVGSIGYAFAQTSGPGAQGGPGADQTQMNQPGTPAAQTPDSSSSTMNNNSLPSSDTSAPATNATNDTSSFQGERAPQADRN